MSNQKRKSVFSKMKKRNIDFCTWFVLIDLLEHVFRLLIVEFHRITNKREEKENNDLQKED